DARQEIAARRRIQAEQPWLTEPRRYAGLSERVAIERRAVNYFFEHIVEDEPHPCAAERVNLAQRACHRLRRQVIRNAHPYDQRMAIRRETRLAQLLDKIVLLEINLDKAQIFGRADPSERLAFDRLCRRMVNLEARHI